MTPVDTLAGSLVKPASASWPTAEALAGPQLERESWKQGWQEMIDKFLIEWGNDPAQLEDEDFVPPSLEVLKRACEVAIKMRDEGCPPPLRVLPDGDGGIVFERRCAKIFQSLRVNPDGSSELDTFQDCKLVASYRLT